MNAKRTLIRPKAVGVFKTKTLTRIADDQENAKVKVQYIGERLGRVQKYENFDGNDTEAENVEYLDETLGEKHVDKETEDGAAMENVVDDESKAKRKPMKDTFYPNAVQCLIALYKQMYSEMKGKTDAQIRSMCVWSQITKKMNESYFNFSESQIREKFRQLRQQYFSVQNAEEIETSEYFDQMHDIYQDKYIDSIATGANVEGERELSNVYIDEDINYTGVSSEMPMEEKMSTKPDEDRLEESHEHNYRTSAHELLLVTDNVIAHKEHEFIDLVEKELQAMEEDQGDDQGNVMDPEVVSDEMNMHEQQEIVETEDINVYPSAVQLMQTIVLKRENDVDPELHLPAAKRFNMQPNAQMVTMHMPMKTASMDHCQKAPASTHEAEELLGSYDGDREKGPMTLAQYNEHQERRHQEKMEMLRQSLVLQERALDIHRTIVEELMHRL